MILKGFENKSGVIKYGTLQTYKISCFFPKQDLSLHIFDHSVVVDLVSGCRNLKHNAQYNLKGILDSLFKI